MPRLMYVGIAAAGQLMGEGVATGMQIRGEPIREIDDASGAQLRYQQSVSLGGQTLPAFRVHPPYRNGVGMTYWQQEVRLPPRGRLEFYTGMGEKAPQRSDGVVFAVEIAPANGEGKEPFERVFEQRQVESRWTPHQVPLEQWGGKRVRLRFVADAGPEDNATTDHALWGAARVVGPASSERTTRNERFMTWVNQKTFESGFYFSEIFSASVDLTFAVEGSEPVYLADLTIHAAPDVMYREFEHGLVVANPSPRAADVDLQELLPGQRFRRLHGAPQQDPAANNGAPVDRILKLQPKEGLFLTRVR